MKRSSFTLIELLVVISIIAFLIAIMVSALQRSRQQAKSVICNSNIKQLALSLLTYETKNQRLPYGFLHDPNMSPPPGYYPGFEYDNIGWWWLNLIDISYRQSDIKITVVQCPSNQLTDSMFKDNILCGNYGVNRSIFKSPGSNKDEFTGQPLRTTDILKPAETLLIVDSGYALISWWHVTNVPPFALGKTPIADTAYIPGLKINKDRNLWPGQKEDAINGRHPLKTVNVGFVDGHTRRTKADDLFVEKTNDGYKNKSPLWAPK